MARLSDASDASWGDWDAPVPEVAAVPSLLDPAVALPSPAAAWAELAAATGWDFAAFAAARAPFDEMQAVRLVNFLRARRAAAAGAVGAEGAAAVAAAVAAQLRVLLDPASASYALAADAPIWRDDEWLRPVLGDDDGLLVAVLSSHDHDDEPDEAEAGAREASSAESAEVAALREQLATARATLARVVGDGDGGGDDSGSDDGDARAGAGAGAATAASARAAADTSHGGVGDNDSYYFESYAGPGIHAEMLRDEPRTRGYEASIRDHQHWFVPRPSAAAAGPVVGPTGCVVDLGCGTGILSMMAAKLSPAVTVTAIDASSIAIDAAAIVDANGFSAEAKARGAGADRGRIAVHRGKLEHLLDTGSLTHLLAGPGGSGCVDVIISEWMGYALLYESMLGRCGRCRQPPSRAYFTPRHRPPHAFSPTRSVLTARDRLLAPGGHLIPSHAAIYLAAFSSDDVWRRHVSWWDDVYGFDMRAMRRCALLLIPARHAPRSAPRLSSRPPVGMPFMSHWWRCCRQLPS